MFPSKLFPFLASQSWKAPFRGEPGGEGMITYEEYKAQQASFADYTPCPYLPFVKARLRGPYPFC